MPSIHIGVDIGFGVHNTAVVATEWLNEESKIRVIYFSKSGNMEIHKQSLT